MSEQLTLQAQPRDRAGKGASRELRRQGRVPAVIYGQGQAPVPIHLEEKALVKALATRKEEARRERVIAVLESEAAVAEVFADDEELGVVIDEFG